MRFIWLLLNLIVTFLVFSQELTLVESFTSTTPIDTWTIDGQNNLLVVSENNIQKKAIKGELRFNQTFKSLGNIHSIFRMYNNPLRLLTIRFPNKET
jgi:hypothetical protein